MAHSVVLEKSDPPQVTPKSIENVDNSSQVSLITSTSWACKYFIANFCKITFNFELFSILYSGADGSTAAADRSVG